jgi:hypothetical protein
MDGDADLAACGSDQLRRLARGGRDAGGGRAPASGKTGAQPEQ